MFFMFPFLLLSIRFLEINNLISKENSQDPNVKRNNKDLIFQDVQNVSSVFPARKSILHIIQNLTKIQSRYPIFNQFNKTPAQEILIKRHIQENDEDDSSLMIKSTKSNIATSARDSKRKWPVVELLAHSDDLNDNLQYFNDFENKVNPFKHDIEKEYRVTEFSPKYYTYVDLHNNHSKVKPVGLRSLFEQKFPGISCEDGDQCVCRLPSKIGAPKPTTTPKTTTTRPPGSLGIDMSFPMGIPVGVPMGVPMGMPAGFPAGYPIMYPAPYPPDVPKGSVPYVPGFPSYYQPNTYKKVPKHKKPSKTHSHTDDYLHYDDDGDEPEDIYTYDEYLLEKKSKHEKQHRGNIFVNVEYDIEESRDNKPNRNPKCRNDQEELNADFFKDIRKSNGDTIIKDCYCCRASTSNINFGIVCFLFILVTFVTSFCYIK